MLGSFIAERKLRDQIVVATKAGFAAGRRRTQQKPARIALAGVCGRPGITSTLMGVSQSEQIIDNAAALKIVLSAEHRCGERVG
jgi:aryl-alcohol dehydrogenase-like predicted oxidoreductase